MIRAMSAAAFSVSGVSAISFLGHCILARDEFADPVDHSDVEVISLRPLWWTTYAGDHDNGN